ncbi:MAG: P pilus assembly chaperone PapD, partial [Oleiphilaceae bacterium]
KIDSKPNYQQIIVRNNSNISVPVEISINEIIFNPENVKPLFSLTPIENDSDLLVFPPAVILEAGEAKAIRVQWNGDEKIPLSKSYFIRFSQPQITQPLQSLSDESGVKIFVHFNAVVHVSSVELIPSLSILPDTLTKNQQQNTINIDVKNNGNSYHYLTPNQIVKINESNHNLSKLPDSIYNKMSDTFLPPHSIRKITIPMDNDWVEGDSLIINAEKK